MTTRRGFLQGILAAGAAPWVCTKAGVLMPVRQIVAPSGLTVAKLLQAREILDANAVPMTGTEVMNAYTHMKDRITATEIREFEILFLKQYENNFQELIIQKHSNLARARVFGA